VATILSRARIGEEITGSWRQAKCIIEFAIRKQTSIGGHDGTAKLKPDAAIKIESKNAVCRFTRRVRQLGLILSA